MNILPPAVTIRKVTAADLPLLEWNGEYAHYRRLYHDIFMQSESRRAVLWLSEGPGYPIIGQLFIQLRSLRRDLADGIFRAYLFSFRVIPALRCQGVGSLMLHKAEQDLIRRRYQRACLNVTQDNPRARQFYERHGYKVLHEDPGTWSYQDNEGQWHDMSEPAWRMEKELLRPVIST